MRSCREGFHTLLQDAGTGDYKERVLFRRMGVVMHYLADYFTFPHNVTYGGSLKDHCLYERDMKYALRSYVRTSEAQQIFRLLADAAGSNPHGERAVCLY